MRARTHGETFSALRDMNRKHQTGNGLIVWGAPCMLRLFMEVRMQNIVSYFCPALVMALFAGAIGLAPAARAEILSISGAGFIQQCPCAPSGNLPDVTKGVLVPTDQSNLYAAVDFPVRGQRICSFSMVYQDINNNDTMTARLFRKSFLVGSNPFNNPTVVAAASTAAGVVNT